MTHHNLLDADNASMLMAAHEAGHEDQEAMVAFLLRPPPDEWFASLPVRIDQNPVIDPETGGKHFPHHHAARALATTLASLEDWSFVSLHPFLQKTRPPAANAFHAPTESKVLHWVPKLRTGWHRVAVPSEDGAEKNLQGVFDSERQGLKGDNSGVELWGGPLAARGQAKGAFMTETLGRHHLYLSPNAVRLMPLLVLKWGAESCDEPPQGSERLA